MAQFKLGKKAPIHDSRTLRFGNYLTPRRATLPARVAFGKNVPEWPMYANDTYADCTCAAAGHMIEAWSANGRGLVVPAENDVIALYAHFVPNYRTHPHEECCMLDVLKYWRASGLGDDKIAAFAQLELKNGAQAQHAIYLFGTLYVGLALPDFAVNAPDKRNVPWEAPPKGMVGATAPNPNNGHCVCAIGYDSRTISVVTWGTVKSMSWEFYNAYSDEVYAVLSSDFLDSRRENPEGFDIRQLKADLDEIVRMPAAAT
jgi:hypothetical protein